MNISAIRSIVYKTCGLLDRIFGRKNSISIFCYHSVSSDDWRYGVSIDELEKQMSILKSKYTFITGSELEAYLNGTKSFSRPVALITFDDGYKDVYSTVSLFKKLHIHPILFILGSIKNRNISQLQTKRDLLSKDELMTLVKNGWTIGNHSMTHADFSKLSGQEIKREVIDSRVYLEKELHLPIRYFAYPKGVYDDRILQAVTSGGYSLGFSMDDGFIHRKTNKLILPRIGVDRSHSLSEFQYLDSPTVILVRGFLKKMIGGLL